MNADQIDRVFRELAQIRLSQSVLTEAIVGSPKGKRGILERLRGLEGFVTTSKWVLCGIGGVAGTLAAGYFSKKFLGI